MAAGISVIICCYNSTPRIEPTLKHLFKQKGISNSDWEVIVIDNASTDNTAEIAVSVWNGLPGEKPAFRVLAEPTPGLSAARKRGIDAAFFDFVLFCDDDNWLAENYLINGLKIMQSDLRIGVLGGTGNPVFEEREPPYFWVNQYHVLAVGEQSVIEGDITDERGVLYGAGMILNKLAFVELKEKFDFNFLVSDRIGNLLISSGDHELCLALKRIGYRVFYSRSLQFQHFIPARRTSIDYYKKLFLGFGISYALLHAYRVRKGEEEKKENDYRYICMRCVKSILVLRLRLLTSGYYFKKNKYKFVDIIHQLYSNMGMLTTFLRVKNMYKKQISTVQLFRVGSYGNNS
jgi:glycosyltransferase involved in cell wall biosynthesis